MEDFRNRLIQVINNSNLSFDCVYYIIKDIYREISDSYMVMLRDQQNQTPPQIEFDNKEEKNTEEK